MSVFVDTSVWYAALDRSDVHNSAATKILSSGERLVTSEHILIETWFLLRRRSTWHVAERFWDSMRSGVATIEPVELSDWEEAWQIGADFREQEFSIVDRTSFAVMRRLGLERAASFDEDFSIYRFGRDRRGAFTILR